MYGLNLLQQKIVESSERIIIVKAGPGTGKTQTLTSRIVYLIDKRHIDTGNILALTFTQRAAAQLRERLRRLFKTTVFKVPKVTTFHGFAYDFLQDKGLSIKIINKDKQNDILRKIIKEYKTSISIKDLSLAITRYKSSVEKIKNPAMEQLFEDYNMALLKEKYLDFDDLLLQTFNMLKVGDTDKKILQNKYKYILIDEFQDTNEVQYQIINQLTTALTNLFVIGDPLQSIYSFRGANPKVFQQLKLDYPEVDEETLDINYRSYQTIVNLSNLLFKDDINLQSFSKLEGKAIFIKTYNEYSEADWIVNFINQKIGGSDLINATHRDKEDPVSFSDFAVIYRTHNLSKVLGKKLNDSGLPFQMVGEESIYENKQVIFICELLNYLQNPTEENQLVILQKYNQKKSVDNLIKTAQLEKSTLSNLVTEIIKLWQLKIGDDVKNQLFSTIIQFDKEQDGLVKYLGYLKKLKSCEYYDYQSDKITLLTMHAAKGLEFKYVVICGFEEGVIPYTRGQVGTEELEEEKRLFYVAITRAKEELYLLFAQNRDKTASQVSQFRKLLESPLMMEVEDGVIAKILKKQEEIKIKQSQLNLF